MAAPDEPPHWLVQPETVKKLWLGFSIVLGLTVLAGLAVHIHGHFGIDGTFGFFAWYGLVTCTAMVFGARWLGKLLKVPDDYYSCRRGSATDRGSADEGTEGNAE